MARSDLLINLVKASSSGDQRLMRSTIEAIVAEEKAKQHHVLADQLQKAMNGFGKGAALLPRGTDDLTNKGRTFVSELSPRRRLDEVILPDAALLACQQIVEEQVRANLLRSHGLEPRHRVLLVGPPGNGKTSLAEALATEMMIPFMVVRYDAIIGSYLGETAGRMRQVFDYARITPCVLFFDEFDAIGKERGDAHETGEIKRVVSSLLMQIDDLPSYVVVIAATNHSELLDRAAWRRFQLRLELPLPKPKELASYIRQHLDRISESNVVRAESIAKQLGRVSYSEAEQFCLDVHRRYVLSYEQAPIAEIVAQQLTIWKTRVIADSESETTTPHAGTPNSETPRS